MLASGPSYYSGRARVIHRYRRPWLLVGVLGAVFGMLLAPAATLAAVEADATLTVRYVDSVTLLPIDGAAVHVTARQGGAVIAEFDATTDADGGAVLTTLPRESGEASPVTIDVTAHKVASFTDAETGCILDDAWDAARLGVAVDGAEVAVEFTSDEQQAVSSLDCPPDVAPPTGEVGGAVGTPGRTLPPTDALADAGPSSAPAALIVSGGAVAAAAVLLLVMPRGRRARALGSRRRRC